MSEELTFEKGTDHDRTTANSESLLRDRTHLMNGLDDSFLAGARRGEYCFSAARLFLPLKKLPLLPGSGLRFH